MSPDELASFRDAIEAFDKPKDNLARLALEHIDSQARQIEALKAGWIAERISGEYSDWILRECRFLAIDYEPFCSELDGPCEYREGRCPIQAELQSKARSQLSAEHPDLFRGLTKMMADSEKGARP